MEMSEEIQDMINENAVEVPGKGAPRGYQLKGRAAVHTVKSAVLRKEGV